MEPTKYLSALAAQLQPYVPGEQPRDRRFIKLNTNESPFPPAPGVAQAIQDETLRLQLYPDPASSALCGALAELHGLHPEQVFAGNGSDEVLAFAFAAFFAGGPLCSVDITYSFYPVFAKLFGAAYRVVPVREDLSIDVQALLGDWGVVLANPNAPTSRALPLEDIRRAAERCHAHGRVLVVDEAYIAFGGESALPLVNALDNVLVVRTFSKAHALAGLRVGYAMGHPALIEGLRRIKDSFNSYPVDRLAEAAAVAAVADRAYFDSCIAAICATRDRCASALKDMGFEVMPSAANFLFIRHPAQAGAALQDALRQQGILVRRFGVPRISDWLRVTVGTDGDMDAVLAALNAKIER